MCFAFLQLLFPFSSGQSMHFNHWVLQLSPSGSHLMWIKPGEKPESCWGKTPNQAARWGCPRCPDLIPPGGFRVTWSQDPQHRAAAWGMAALERKMEFCQKSDNSGKLLSINGLITFLTTLSLAGLECLPCLLLPSTHVRWHYGSGLTSPLFMSCAGVIFSPSCLNKFQMCQYQCLYHRLIESAKRIADIFCCHRNWSWCYTACLVPICHISSQLLNTVPLLFHEELH